MKEIIKNHMIAILCIISLIALFFPMVTVVVDMEVMGYSAGSEQRINGFTAIKEGFLGFLLLAGPVLLIAMNYIKQLEKHKGLLAIVIPIVCIVVLIVVFIQSKSVALSAMGYAESGETLNLDIKTKIGIGSILALLSYIGTVVAGAVTYHNFSISKEGLEKLKTEGAHFVQAAQGRVKETVQNVSNSIEISGTKEQDSTHTGGNKQHSQKISVNRTEEILALIERLSKMKDAGIITEEEFKEKKIQLLAEI